MNLFKSFDRGIRFFFLAKGRPPLQRHVLIKSTPLEGLAAPTPWWWCLLGLSAFCVVSNSWLISRTHHTYVLEVLQSVPPRLAPYPQVICINGWFAIPTGTGCPPHPFFIGQGGCRRGWHTCPLFPATASCHAAQEHHIPPSSILLYVCWLLCVLPYLSGGNH